MKVETCPSVFSFTLQYIRLNSVILLWLLLSDSAVSEKWERLKTIKLSRRKKQTIIKY